jgi:hypothetical protein
MGRRSGFRNIRRPFREPSNAAVAYAHIFPMLVARRTVRTEDVADGFRLVPDSDAATGNPTDRAAQFMSYLHGYGLVAREKGTGHLFRRKLLIYRSGKSNSSAADPTLPSGNIHLQLQAHLINQLLGGWF